MSGIWIREYFYRKINYSAKTSTLVLLCKTTENYSRQTEQTESTFSHTHTYIRFVKWLSRAWYYNKPIIKPVCDDCTHEFYLLVMQREELLTRWSALSAMTQKSFVIIKQPARSHRRRRCFCWNYCSLVWIVQQS